MIKPPAQQPNSQSKEPLPKTYSVPRRFGIGTILAVATAFALLIWCLQLMNTPPAAIVTIALFLSVVGGMQALFEKAPRLASIVAGQACMLGFVGFSLFQEGAVAGVAAVDWIRAIGACLISGMIIGYVGGTVVASLFLVMDKLTGALRRQPHDDDRSPFDDPAK